MAFPNPADVGQITSDPSLVLMRQEGFNIGYLGLNVTKKPFEDVRVRRAVNMAIDKQAIVEAVYEGAGVVAKNPIPPTLWSYNDDVKDYPYDPDGARKLLAESGHADGFDTAKSRRGGRDGLRLRSLACAELSDHQPMFSLLWSPHRTYRKTPHLRGFPLADL